MILAPFLVTNPILKGKGNIEYSIRKTSSQGKLSKQPMCLAHLALPDENRVEGEIVGSTTTRCVCNLPIINKERFLTFFHN